METGYVENFDPEWYLSTYLSVDIHGKEGTVRKFMLDTAYEFLSTGVELNGCLLDVGTGPTIYSVLIASRHVKHIDLSDLLPRNLEILRDRKSGKRITERGIMVYEMNLAGDRRTEREREEELRGQVNGIYRIDLTHEDVFLDSKPSIPLYDVITSSLCLEAVSTSKEVYESSVRNISKYLRRGGHFLLFGVLGSTFYRVGNCILQDAELTAEETRGAFERNGYTVMKYKTMFIGEIAKK